MNTAAGRLVFKIEPPNHIDPRDLEDVLATDELFLNYFNEFLALPTFPEALFFNKNTGWFEIVDGAKQKLSQRIKAAVRASKKLPKIYRAVNHHSFTNLPLIPLEENFDLAPEEIDTSFTVTTLNKEQGLRWIKDNRFPSFLQSDLYIEYRLAKILSQTNDSDVDKKESVSIQLDYTPHPTKIRPEDIVEEEPEDDSEILLKNMCVCMGEAHPTVTEAFLSRARLLEGTLTTSSTTDSRPISSLVRPDSGLGSLTRLSTDQTSSDDEITSRLFVPSSKKARSVTPRPNDVVCHTTESAATPEKPAWKNSPSGSVYVTPSSGEGDGERQVTYLDELERLAAESTMSKPTQEETPPPASSIVFKSVDELASVIAGTVVKYMLAEFNNSQPEVYAHHKAVRDLISDTSMRDYSLTDIDNSSCEWVIETEDDPQEDQSDKPMEVSVNGQSKIKETKQSTLNHPDSDEDSVLGSDGDYEEDRDDYFRRNKNKKFHALNCKQGIDDFRQFLKGTPGEKHWMLWIDIDRARTLGPDLIDMHMYIESIRDRYHKKGSVFELALGTKQVLQLTDSSQWTMEKLYSLQNKIAEPLLVYWAPRYIVKNQVKATPGKLNADYRNQKSVRACSARRQIDTHPEPRMNGLLPLRPKSCKPNIKTRRVEIEDLYSGPTPKDFVWQPPEAVALPETRTPIGRRRTHAVESVKLCNDYAGGNKQRVDHEARMAGTTSRPISRMRARPHSANPIINSSVQTKNSKVRPATATGALQANRISNGTVKSVQTQKTGTASRTTGPGREGIDVSDTRTLTDHTELPIDTLSKTSDESAFSGGRRMDALLKALNHEHESGLFIRKYIQYTKNKIWLACLKFWEETQEYHKLFYSESMNKYLVTKKAKEIFSQYVAKTATHFIGCTCTIIHCVQVQLSPPYEELFDDAELYALEQLLQAWQSMGYKDQRLLQQVQTKSIVVNLETKSKLVINLQRKGFLRPGDLEPDEDPMENFEDPEYDDSLFEEIPEDFKDFTLEKIIRTAIHLENFRQFLQSHFATMDLSCWMDIEQLRRMDPKLIEEADEKAKDIKQKYFNKKYFFGPNSPATREGLDIMMKAIGGWGKIFPDRPDDALIIGAQDFVRDRLSLKWLPMFLASEQFAELIRPSQQMVDAAEALLLNRQRRNQRLMKMLEGRWVSSSKEIIAFRRSLLNPVISYQFQRFVSIKSDLLENDVLFWRECQKYKHLHHQHTDDSFIVQKINVIINCYISTSMEPSLQLDIPQEQADRITEKKRELGPYIFREAQLTVFRVLFEFWADFCTFQSNTATEQILPTIERKRRRAKLKERQRQKEAEEQQERENARRRALGLPVEGEDNEEAEGLNAGSARQKEEDEDKSETAEGLRVAWSYSNYMDALEKEDIVNRTNEDTFSCLSGESRHDKPNPPKATVDVSDLKDVKAPQEDKPPEIEPETKPTSKKSRKSQEKSGANAGTTSPAKDRDTQGGKLKPSPPSVPKTGASAINHKPDKKVAMQLDNINRSTSAVKYKPADKTVQPLSRAMPPLIKK